MKTTLFAVIDTNVIVSALISTNPKSPPFIIMAHVYAGSIIPVYNDEIIREYRDVLSRPRFHLSLEGIENALSVIQSYGLNLERTQVEGTSFPDSKDAVFYEVKMSREDAYLITGNIKHFPRNPLVVAPREFLDIMSTIED